MTEYRQMPPAQIERESFAIIRRELALRNITLLAETESVVLRVIHTTADFEYAETLSFSPDAMDRIKEAIRNGAHIVTDTNMALAGISKGTLERFGGRAHCFMADGDVAAGAKARGVTRAAISMEKAMRLDAKLVFAIGNAPTALLTIYEAIRAGYRPELIIGVPVGFVNVVQAKELIMKTEVPYIVNRGRKGGSAVAAAICNAVLYEMAADRE